MIRNIINNLIVKEYKFKYLIFSIISGVFLALSFQKFNLFLFAWVAFIPLIYCIYKKNLKNSVLYVFIASITYSIIAFNWMFLFLLSNTKSVIDSFIVSIIVWLILSSYFSVWGIVLSFIKKTNKLLLIAFVSALWVILEYIRNYSFGSFPINLLGYSQGSFKQIIQIADIFGVYVISFVIILINFLIFYWLYYRNKKYLISAMLIFLSLLIYGNIRINQISNINNEEKIQIGVVQPNIGQKEKWEDRYKNEILSSIEKLVIENFKNKSLDLMVYPETMLPGYLKKDVDLQDFVKNISYVGKINLIGGIDLIFNTRKQNSVFITSQEGKIINKYNKKHLIVFGEYIPFEGMIATMFSKFIRDNNLTKEIELKVFKFDNYTLGINICSENYYPYLSRELVLKGATLLTTHSNDAWCDGLSYPYQHFILNIFRAIENRKYLIVSANTGISAVIAPTGKIIRQTKNQEQICLEETVYTNNYMTIYDKIGDLFVYLCMIYVVLILLIYGIFQKKKIQINK